jgi:AcrR family transcriptional regulator
VATRFTLSHAPPLVHDAAPSPSAPFVDPLPSDERIDRILAAAVDAFGTRGFTATTLAGIARRAHVSPATLLLHFASKEELFREIVRTMVIATLDPAARDAVDEHASSADALRAVAMGYWRTMERPELVAILRLVIGELPRFPELAALHATEGLERLVHGLERIILRGIARGELRPVDVRATARTIVATLAAHALWFCYPGIYAGLTGPDRDRAAEATIEAVIETLSSKSPSHGSSSLAVG